MGRLLVGVRRIKAPFARRLASGTRGERTLHHPPTSVIVGRNSGRSRNTDGEMAARGAATAGSVCTDGRHLRSAMTDLEGAGLFRETNRNTPSLAAQLAGC
jgi:hypothetical protein